MEILHNFNAKATGLHLITEKPKASFTTPQNINEILAWLNYKKNSNEYILRDDYKNKINKLLSHASDLKTKGIVNINGNLFTETANKSDLFKPTQQQIDDCANISTDNLPENISMNIKCTFILNSRFSPHDLIERMFLDLWNDDEKRRVDELHRKQLISSQTAERLRKAQELRRKREEAALKIRKKREESSKQLLINKSLQNKKQEQKKLLMYGGIGVLAIVGGIIINKVLK